MSIEQVLEQQRDDLRQLIEIPAFRRLLWRTIADSNIFASTHGADGRNLVFHEGRRSLALDILGWVEAAQPVPQQGAPVLTMLAVLREAASSIPEKTSGRRSRDDRNRDPDDGHDGDDRR